MSEPQVASALSTLREPAHRVSFAATRYWAVTEFFGALVQLAILGSLYFFLVPDSWTWWAGPLLVLMTAISVLEVAVKPIWRYHVHRWEVTPTAVYTRSGAFSREVRIAPLSRVQTVDSKRGALMRVFGLASITVTTASAAGPIEIDGLDLDVAEQVVAELTEITGQTQGDAT